MFPPTRNGKSDKDFLVTPKITGITTHGRENKLRENPKSIF